MHRLAAIAALMAGFGLASAQSQIDPAERLLQEIKLHLFDENWTAARNAAREMQARFPEHRRIGQAQFYEARALQNLGESEAALLDYEAVIKDPRGAENLVTQARLALVGLAVQLDIEGNPRHVHHALEALRSGETALKYYAALRLSLSPRKETSRRAISVLREILHDEQDPDLRNRATLALLRIDPDLLTSQELRPGTERSSQSRWLHVRMEENGRETFSIRVPLSLASALFKAVPASVARDLEREGIRPGNLLEELEKMQGRILEFRDEGSVFRIWIE